MHRFTQVLPTLLRKTQSCAPKRACLLALENIRVNFRGLNVPLWLYYSWCWHHTCFLCQHVSACCCVRGRIILLCSRMPSHVLTIRRPKQGWQGLVLVRELGLTTSTGTIVGYLHTCQLFTLHGRLPNFKQTTRLVVMALNILKKQSQHHDNKKAESGFKVFWPSSITAQQSLSHYRRNMLVLWGEAHED